MGFFYVLLFHGITQNASKAGTVFVEMQDIEMSWGFIYNLGHLGKNELQFRIMCVHMYMLTV